jgi:hypothetical protein
MASVGGHEHAVAFFDEELPNLFGHNMYKVKVLSLDAIQIIPF